MSPSKRVASTSLSIIFIWRCDKPFESKGICTGFHFASCSERLGITFIEHVTHSVDFCAAFLTPGFFAANDCPTRTTTTADHPKTFRISGPILAEGTFLPDRSNSTAWWDESYLIF